MIPVVQSEALDPGSAQARQFRRDVCFREDCGQRRRLMRHPHLRIPAEDAVDRRGLCTHGQDAPPPAGVRQRGRPAKERVQGCHLEADEIVDHLEHVRTPPSAFLARKHDEVDTFKPHAKRAGPAGSPCSMPSCATIIVCSF